MKTVGEFKKAGLLFVEGDMGEGFEVLHPKEFGSFFDDANVESFAWRENTGIKPEFNGLMDIELAHGLILTSHDLSKLTDFDWIANDRINLKITKWRPSLNQPSIAGHDAKQSAEEKRMDIIGQNGNDGLHYDNTAQLVEVIINNNTLFSIELAEKGGFHYELKASSSDKPIFTQEMADNGELPPVGSEFLPIENEKDAQTCLGYTSRGKVVGEGVGGGVVSLFFVNEIKPLDTRTDREKAIDAALSEWPVADKATLEIAYDFWRVGEI